MRRFYDAKKGALVYCCYPNLSVYFSETVGKFNTSVTAVALTAPEVAALLAANGGGGT